MTDNDLRRDDMSAEVPASDEAAPAKAAGGDALVEALRDIPRMRKIKDDRWDGKIIEPPPPTISRFGGIGQGCGGLLLTLASIPMVLAAMWYGYYLWGPALLMSGGILLLGGVAGVWAGRRTAIIATLVILIGVLVVGLQWSTFVPAAGALAPLGQLSLVYTPLTMLMAFVLVGTFMVHVFTLAYWMRLKPQNTRGFMLWGGGAVVLIVISLVVHFYQQSARNSWMDDRMAEWNVAEAEQNLTLGTNANITLGYSFVTVEEDDDTRVEVRDAELDALLDSGAQVLRLSAGGDMLLEMADPLMFTSVDEGEGDDARTEDEIAARRDARFARQQQNENAYMAQVEASGVDLYISDSQYSPYFLLWASDEDREGDRVAWEDFVQLHSERVQFYAEQYEPAYYEIINEPSAYEQYSGIEKIDDDGERMEAWLTHTAGLRDIVNTASPDTQVGVGIALSEDFDLAYYEAVLQMDGIDFIGFRIFQPAAYQHLEDLFEERGYPSDAGKDWWITETWYGFCLAPQRSMDLDGKWLEVSTTFSAHYNGSGVMASDFGCFIEPGGTLFGEMSDPDQRTDVFEAWRDLVAEWIPASTEE